MCFQFIQLQKSGCRAGGLPFWLPGDDSQLIEAIHIPCNLVPFIFKLAVMHQIILLPQTLHVLWIWLPLVVPAEEKFAFKWLISQSHLNNFILRSPDHSSTYCLNSQGLAVLAGFLRILHTIHATLLSSTADVWMQICSDTELRCCMSDPILQI